MVDAINVVSLSTLEAQAEASLATQAVADQYATLGGALRDIFNTHERVRRESGVEDQMISALYDFNGMYTSDKKAKLEATGLSTVFFGLVGEKCVDAMSWLSDVFLGETSKPWRLKATPMPEVPEPLAQVALSAGIREAKSYMEGLGREPAPEDQAKLESLVRTAIQNAILAEAEQRSRNMERKIDDQLTEGGWGLALQDFLFDAVVGKAAILKGPVVRERQRRTWKTKPDGSASIGYAWKPTLTVSRVSPFDAYPSASTVGFEGDFVERTRYNLSDLFWMLKQKHFVESQVRDVIANFQSLAGSDVRTVDSTVAPVLQGQTGQAKVEGTVEGLDYWLTVTGQFLVNAGWTKMPFGGEIQADQLYHIEAITAAGRVVFLGEVENPLGAKPYFKTGWQAIPGSFWYRSLPEVLKDIGDMGNASARSLANNMALASGFQVIIPDVQRLLGDKLTVIFPHKVWQFKNPTNSPALPIDFKQPNSNASELLSIINECRQWADARSGVPKYLVGGSPPPGVGRTASGISMLLNSAAKGIRRVVIAIDRDVVCPLIQRIYEKNLADSADAAILGDVEVAPAGAVETLVKAELAERRLSLIDALGKSEDRDLVEVQSRSRVWRDAFRSVEMDSGDIMVPIERIEQKAERAAQAEQTKAEAEAQAMQAEAQAKAAEVEIAQAKLAVEKQRLEMESKILALKLEAQIAENQQRAAITKRMASSADLKTAEQLGKIGVRNEDEPEEAPPPEGAPADDVRANLGAMETAGVAPAEPGMAGAPGLSAEVSAGSEQVPVDAGGGPLDEMPGGGAAVGPGVG